MEGKEPDEFDDFFDTPGRSRQDSSTSEIKKQQSLIIESSPNRSAKKQNRNNSASGSVGRRSVSSDHYTTPDYSSDSVTESDSDSESRDSTRQKSRSRSRSASSRSGGSSSSDSSSNTSYSSRDDRSRSSKNKGRRSRSRSESTDKSTSGTTTPIHESKRKSKNRRRYSYSSVSSSSTYSESKSSVKRSPSPRPARRQAWDTEEKNSNTRKERPKTAKRRSSDEKFNRGPHRKEHNGKNHVDTDSDITDVSPIPSPRSGSICGYTKESGDKHHRGKPAVYQAMPLGIDDSSHSGVRNDDTNALDLNILMKAVSELEKQKRVKSNTRRVMFEPLRARPSDKSNYTFSNDDTHRIEQENKRLLRQIMQQVQSTGEKQRVVTDVRVKQSTLTPSAINRRRDQQRIENENLAFLKRLQKIKPTKGLSRTEQLTSYNSTVLHGIPIATLHPAKSGLRSGRQSSASSIAGSLGRTRSLTSVHSAATASSFGTASRQSSRAGSRPTSAKKSVRERPPWNDRW